MRNQPGHRRPRRARACPRAGSAARRARAGREQRRAAAAATTSSNLRTCASRDDGHGAGPRREPRDGGAARNDEAPRGALRVRLLRARAVSRATSAAARGATPTSSRTATRIDEDSYAELELRREDTFVRRHHEQGRLHARRSSRRSSTSPATRRRPSPSGTSTRRRTYGDLTMWVGSRMYRGDDIYLLDWWPLDNQNTVGGGVGVKVHGRPTRRRSPRTSGMQRLDRQPYQYEQIPGRSRPFDGSARPTSTVLDRPRTIETLKLTQLFRNTKRTPGLRRPGFKAILYGEAQEISAGVYTDTTGRTVQTPAYPRDSGFLVGGELAYWTGRARHVRPALRPLRRRARRLRPARRAHRRSRTTGRPAAPTRRSSRSAATGSGACSGSSCGGYLRFFRDGDPSADDVSTSTTRARSSLRPQLFFGEHWGLAVEGSYQERRYAVLDPNDRPAARRVRVARRRHPVLLSVGPRLVQAAAAPRHLRPHRAQRGRAGALPGAGRLLAAHRRALPRPRAPSGGSTRSSYP